MTEKLREKHLDEISEAAADWFALERAGDMTGEERARLAAWLSAAPEHNMEYREVRRLWTELDGLEEDLAVPVPAHAAPPARLGGWAVQGGLALAAVALLVIGVTLVNVPEGEGVTYRTATGDQTSIKLDDGSIMHLNAQSVAHVNFTKNRRGVSLMKGEALFKVAKDPDRVFEVTAGKGKVRALGTLFNVLRRDQGATVTVIEGTVRVTEEAGGGDGSSAWRTDLSQGEQVAYGLGHVPQQVARVNLEPVVAWRQRRLIFEAEPLRLVVERFNRFNGTKIVIADAELGQIEVSGAFDADDTRSLLNSLQRVAKIRVMRVAGQLTLLVAEDQS